MRPTTERMKLAKKRADEMKKRRSAKKDMLAAVSCYSFCIVLIVAISADCM